MAARVVPRQYVRRVFGFCQDRIRRSRPDEGPCRGLVGGEEGINFGCQFLGTSKGFPAAGALGMMGNQTVSWWSQQE